MKKIDKLVFTSFIGPFVLTSVVVVFILLTQFMLKYFDDIVGKDLSVGVIAQLIFYFSIYVTMNAFPLAILLSSLMTFGNLGEHFELTALKGAGISLLRIMRPIFIFSLFFMGIGFFNNNYIIPKANLEAFSLLYDIKRKKPALDIKEGVFYSGIPGYSIKINHKFPDDEHLKDIIIYDHMGTTGNKKITIADSGRMYSIFNNRYLVFELFDGKNYAEQPSQNRRNVNLYEEPTPYLRSKFDKSKMVFDLSDFDLKRTRKELFSNNRLMKNISELKAGLDSMHTVREDGMREIKLAAYRFFNYHMRDKMQKDLAIQRARNRAAEKPEGLKIAEEEMRKIDSVEITPDSSFRKQQASVKKEVKVQDKNKKKKVDFKNINPELAQRYHKLQQAKEMGQKLQLGNEYLKNNFILDTLMNTDSVFINFEQTISAVEAKISDPSIQERAVSKALNQIRYAKTNINSKYFRIENLTKTIRKFNIEKYKKFAMAFTILIMFLIGAPLGAIIKRGGLGVPVLFSIFFFILFYVFSILGEKWARQGLISEIFGVWMANLVLLPIGLVFLRQARRDARLFDADYYAILINRVRKKLGFKDNKEE